MGHGLAIREDVATATELRRLAKKEPHRRTAMRMLALANAMDGMSVGRHVKLDSLRHEELDPPVFW